MKVLKNNVIVKVEESASKTKDEIGLYLPGELDSKGLEKAEVINIGSEVKDLEIGETCYIYKGLGQKFINPSDGQEYRTISEDAIIVVF